MSLSINSIAIRDEHDVVLARQRARQIAALLGFPDRDQVRLATAVSEIARNVFLYAIGGKVEFRAREEAPHALEVRVTDRGPGIANLQQILNGGYVSKTGMGMGILGTRRLMHEFTIESAPGAGTTAVLRLNLPHHAPALTPKLVAEVGAALAKMQPSGHLGELQRQNQELLAALEELEQRQGELAQLNKELEDTNRGVVALYAELDEKADYLRRASELKTQFLSNMTHEFRTPLNSVLSLCRILLDRLDGELTSEQERQVKFIHRAANDLSELVNDLLDLAKVEAGKITIRPLEFQVQALFGALRGMLRPLLAHNTSVSLVFEEPRDLPPLLTDETKVSQVLRNLISNALKYTEHGDVRVRAWSEPGDLVAFAVSDTGVGIALSDQDRIFEEFSQVEGAHQQGKQGTGLGLPLSRKLAEMLGGTLTLQSEPGVGSTFTLRVPTVYHGPVEVSVVPDLTTEVDPTRRPVLVVEDNRETLFVYEKFFKASGFQLIPARTLKQARELLGRCRPIAIILDILLAHENTWAFLSEFKSNAVTREVPLYVVTVVENQHKALALGADDFHVKPIDREWLMTRLQALAALDTSDVLLVVDDDEASRYVLRGLLSETRFRVIETASGCDGLRVAKERKPAAIFLDLVMPDLNGVNALELLRSDPTTANLPVIIHTDKVLTEEERNRLAPKVVDIIPKTHTDRQVSLSRIREALLKAGVRNPSRT